MAAVKEKNYSLTPDAYVGVAEQEDDGMDFHERMTEIHAELAQLNTEVCDRLIPRLINGEIDLEEKRPERPTSS